VTAFVPDVVIEILLDAILSKSPLNTELFEEMVVPVIHTNHAMVAENTCEKTEGL
jgi:hypothetical protein